MYENEEFNLIQAALGIEEDLEDLRYNRSVYSYGCGCRRYAHPIAPHYFLSAILSELIRQGHLFVLQTPLFRYATKRPRFTVTTIPSGMPRLRP